MAIEAESGREMGRVTLPSGMDEWREDEIPPVPPGTYRLTASGGPTAQPVTELFVISSEGV